MHFRVTINEVMTMKKIKLLSLLLACLCICGCSKKYMGTWCLYTDTPTSLIILKSDVSDSDLTKIKAYIESLSDLKSYDVIPKIEDANQMINVYYQNDENTAKYLAKLSAMSGVESVTNDIKNIATDSIKITSKDYTYGTKLDTKYAFETTGTYKISGNVLTLDSQKKLYYKDSYLCLDETCNTLFSKVSGDSCNK